MDQPPPYEVIAMTADIACGVFGACSERGTGFHLVPLGPGLTDADRALITEKAFTFCGVLGLRNGEPLQQCEPDPESIGVMVLAAVPFIRQYAHYLEGHQAMPATPGDSVDWLGKLMSIPDTRPN